MGDLRPLGSEKLDGMDKIKRILEIARFNESIPNSVNETSNKEYSINLADGNQYAIFREKAGYIIKQIFSESEQSYLAPISDRKYFKSYSQALKRLNLMAKEMNERFENSNGVSLFSEQKKFVLKTPKGEKKNSDPIEDVENVPAPPVPPSAPTSSTPPPSIGDDMGATPPPPTGGEMETPPPPIGDETGMPSDEPSLDMDEPSLGSEGEKEDKTEVVTFKTIQKLTGKLGQKLRQFSSSEEGKMSSKDVKYVINSILSALDLSLLDDDDRDEIMGKFDGEEMESDESMGFESEEMPSEEPETEEMPTPELGEGTWPELASEIGMKTIATGMMPTNEFNEDENKKHLKSIVDSVFVESKIEDIIMKYFDVSKSEKKFLNEIESERSKKIEKRNKRSIKEIEILSETDEQRESATKFLMKNPKCKFIGKTNLKNLVFEVGYNQFKINKNGKLL